MDKKSFQTYANEYGIKLNEQQCELLMQNMAMVIKINCQVNLTAITEELPFADKHLIDSLMCDLGDLKPHSKVIDIGTGGGFPGIPLAILYPGLEFTLMDATMKKIRIVEEIAEKLCLKNVHCICGRAESLAKDKNHREKYNVAVSRGVAAYSVLAELCAPFVKPKGCFYAWKGPKYREELDAAKNAMAILQLKEKNLKEYHLINTDESHVIIRAEKTGHTPAQYPRNYGAIKKKPL